MRSRTVGLLALALATACGVLAACSLGLDEGLLDAASDSGPVTNVPETSTVVDGGSDAATSGLPTTCATDEDCVATNACLKGRCDLTRSACVFDVCKAAACNAGTCDQAAASCKDPKPYTLRTTTFKVGTPLACGRCIAAVHPYLFVGTTTGIVGYNVANPAGPAPVQVRGLGFAPTLMIASGSRVFLFGAPLGGGPPARMPFAWIDVPSDPFRTSFTVEDTLAGWDRPSGEGTGAFARGSDGALVYSGAAGLPAAAVASPPMLPVDFASYPTPTPPGHGLVSMSGTRFLVQAVDGTGAATFGFVPNAGTAQVSDAGLTVGAAPAMTGTVAAPQYFAQGPDGTVLWAYAQPNVPPATPGAVVRATRASFLVSGQAGPAAGASVDVEVYPAPPPLGTAVTGPIAALDADTALVVSAARESVATQVSVHFLRRQPLGLVPNADNQPRRAVLPIAIGTLVGAAGSNGIGYLAANEAATPQVPANASVYVFDPACAP